MGGFITAQQGSPPLSEPDPLFRFGPGKDAPLSDAVGALLRNHRNIEIDILAAANRGEIRWLKNVLADNGALRQKGPAQANLVQYDIEISQDQVPIEAACPRGYAWSLSELNQGKSLPVRKLLNTHADIPFGQGPVGAVFIPGLLCANLRR